MKRCEYCGKELDSTANYCPNCGKKIMITQTSIDKEDNCNRCINETNKNTNTSEGCIESGGIESGPDALQRDSKGCVSYSEEKTSNNEADKKSVLKGFSMYKILTYISGLGKLEKLVLGLMAFFVVLSVVASVTKHHISYYLAMTSFILCVISFLIMRKAIIMQRRHVEKGLLIISIILLVPYMLLFDNKTENGDRIMWANIRLGDHLPQPMSDIGELYLNTYSFLDLKLENITPDEYYEYVNSCEETGFSFDVNQSTYYFEAFDETGYKLSLSYDEYSDVMNISLSVPDTFNEFNWEDIIIKNMLPKPRSSLGTIIANEDNKLELDLGNMDVDEYRKYVTQCKEYGFNQDIETSDNQFIAKNQDDYKLTLEYKGGKVVSLTLDEPEYEIELEVKCVENLIFSKYDIDVYVDDSYEMLISHGKARKTTLMLKAGEHTFRFENEEDDGVYGEVELDVETDDSIKYTIHCHSDRIDVDLTKRKSETNKSQESNSISEADEQEIQSDEQDNQEVQQSESDETSVSVEGDSSNGTEKDDVVESVFYSTNDYEGAKKGNTGVFAYRNKGPQYDIYWIIDFDERYVYYFTDGNGDSTCDKVKIDSGDLNDKVIITYHDGTDVWSYGLHFKYVGHPDTLIMEDQNGFEYKYSATDLTDALSIRSTRSITEY